MASGQAETIIGIDLGTTNSLVAFADERGPRVIHSVRGGGRDSGMVPSVVAIDPVSGAVDVGMSARVHAIERPEVTVYSIKRLMGRGFEDVQGEIGRLPYRVVRRPGSEGRDLAAVQIGERVYSPPEISRLRAARPEGAGGGAFRAAHPARRSSRCPRTSTMRSARRRGTPARSRASRWCGSSTSRRPRRWPMGSIATMSRRSRCTTWEAGRSTFRFCGSSGGTFEVLSTHGDTHLGGDDFDWEIIHLVQQEVRKRFGEHLQFPPSTLQGLRDLAESGEDPPEQRGAGRVRDRPGGGRGLPAHDEPGGAREDDRAVRAADAGFMRPGDARREARAGADRPGGAGGRLDADALRAAAGAGAFRQGAVHGAEPGRGGGAGGGGAGVGDLAGPSAKCCCWTWCRCRWGSRRWAARWPS